MTVAERSEPGTPPARTTLTLTAYVEWDECVRRYVGSVPGIPGAHTQAATLVELRDNLREVLELLVEADMVEPDELPRFAGVQQLEVAVDEGRTLTATAYVEWGAECSVYVGIVPGIQGAYTQGATLDDLRDNLRDVLELLVDEGEVEPDEIAGFVGVQQLEITV